MSGLLSMATSVLLVVAPFLVLLVLATALGCGLVLLLGGLRVARPLRAGAGVLVVIGSVVSAITVLNWSSTKPAQGDTSSVHALVYTTWQQTLSRLKAMGGQRIP